MQQKIVACIVILGGENKSQETTTIQDILP